MIDTLVQQRALFFIKSTRTPRLRTRREFFEQEVVIPTGDFAGMRWRADRQPCWALFLDELDRAQEHGWNEYNVTGTTQSGKSLHAFAGQVLYDLFELGESVAVGVPGEKMIASKWQRDIRPLIAASRYKHLLPKRGAGSQGGMPEMVTFQNGAVLRFFTGGGSDKTVAGETYKIIRVTETDGMDTAGEASREANRVDQLKARAMSYGDNYLWGQECTLSTEQGRTWQDHTKSTASRIVCPCPECKEWVTPLREHFSFDKDAKDVIAARESGQWCCPECGYAISEDDRASMNRAAKLVHRTEEDGSPVRTLMFSFRMTAFNNIFVGAARVAQQEWEAVHSENPDDAEKKLCQFVHCMPYVPDIEEVSPLHARELTKRTEKGAQRGVVPADATQFCVGIDPGKRWCHWAALAWRNGELRGNVVEYGNYSVYEDRRFAERKRNATKEEDKRAAADEDAALFDALCHVRESILEGWQTEDGKTVIPSECWIDAGWKTHVVYRFVRDCRKLNLPCMFRPCSGFGTAKRIGMTGTYRHPLALNKSVRHIGEMYHFKNMSEERLNVIQYSADYWKGWLWRRLSTPGGNPGSIMLYSVMQDSEHRDYTESITAEREEIEFVPGEGEKRFWRVVKKNKSHWLDSSSLACMAMHFKGARLATPKKETPKPRGESKNQSSMATPDGRPFLVTER